MTLQYLHVSKEEWTELSKKLQSKVCYKILEGDRLGILVTPYMAEDEILICEKPE